MGAYGRMEEKEMNHCVLDLKSEYKGCTDCRDFSKYCRDWFSLEEMLRERLTCIFIYGKDCFKKKE